VGTEAFDRFLKTYIATFRFRSITTDDFLALLDRELPEARAKVDLLRWIDGPGLPADAPRTRSVALEQVEALARAFSSGELPSEAVGKEWSATEWQVYLSNVERPAPADRIGQLGARFNLGTSTNAEILIGYLTLCARSGYTAAFPAIGSVLRGVGRMKYLRPLYAALIAAGGAAAQLAHETFAIAKLGYHPVARNVIESLLEAPPAAHEETL
jgi:leukotriene-A4 hydrolase